MKSLRGSHRTGAIAGVPEVCGRTGGPAPPRGEPHPANPITLNPSRTRLIADRPRAPGRCILCRMLAPEDPTDPLSAALGYRALGWAPLPVVPRGKRPLVPWSLLQDRLPSEAEIRTWFATWPKANVGIVTGRVSGLVVLDVDPAHGGTGSFAALEQQHGPLPPGVEAITGGGGRHIYFAHPGGAVRNRTGFAPGLDLRGDGGMVVAPPSVHPGGGRYRWRTGHAPGETPLAPLPAWLAAPAEGKAGAGHPASHWRELVREGVEAGRRNATLASFTGHLLWQGVDPDVVLELMLAWNRVRCRPPLSDDEVARTVRSIARTHARGRDTDGR